MSDEARPYPKSSQLARGERRYRRKVASPKQWQKIIEAKRGPCRVAPRFVLLSGCLACNRETGTIACDLCAKLEVAEQRAGDPASPQLAYDTRLEYHHLVPRSQGGDDVADNIVPLSSEGHALVTMRQPEALRRLAESLTEPEREYVTRKRGALLL